MRAEKIGLTSPSVDGATLEYRDSHTTSDKDVGLFLGTPGNDWSQFAAK